MARINLLLFTIHLNKKRKSHPVYPFTRTFSGVIIHLMKYFIFLIILVSCSTAPLPEPYSQLKEVLPYDGHGWYMNKEPMKKLLAENNIKTVIEVGSWLGKSTRHIAKHLPKKGKVYAVDHWLGSAEHQPNGSADCKDLSTLYDQFLSNVIHAKLTDKIIPIRMASIDAEKHLSHVIPDLIYIDASHETEAVYQDLTVWYPHIKGHGILCGDDWTYPEVREAVYRFAAEQTLNIESEGNFWRLK